MDIFKISDTKNNELRNDLTILLKKEIIINVIKALINFIEKTNVKQEQLTKILETIKNSLEEDVRN